MAGTQGRISLRLDEDDLQALDGLVARKGYNSRSDALRDAIEGILAEQAEGANFRRASVDIPLSLQERIDALVDLGELLDRKSGLLEVLRRGVEGLEEDSVQRSELMDEHRARVLRSRKEREETGRTLRP